MSEQPEMRAVIVDDVLSNLIFKTRNSTVDTAAKVAKLYGASDEVIEHILMLKQGPKP